MATGALKLALTGGQGPYTVVIRADSETTGNRFTGTNPVNSVSNLPFELVPDGMPHDYHYSVTGTCGQVSGTISKSCDCPTIAPLNITTTCSSSDLPTMHIMIAGSPGQSFVIEIFDQDGTNQFYLGTHNNNTSFDLPIVSGTEYLVTHRLAGTEGACTESVTVRKTCGICPNFPQVSITQLCPDDDEIMGIEVTTSIDNWDGTGSVYITVIDDLNNEIYGSYELIGATVQIPLLVTDTTYQVKVELVTNETCNTIATFIHNCSEEPCSMEFNIVSYNPNDTWPA